jgi:hypothetical protein
MNIDKNKFSNPAILLGNGLNNYCKLPVTWKKLLIELSNNSISDKILKDNGISYPEIFDVICFNDEKEIVNYSSLKEQICKKITAWSGTKRHEEFIDFVRQHEIPVLTTNYDLTLETSILKKEGKKPDKTNNRPVIDRYPWYSYYSDHEINNPLCEFAIWHIHGFQYYKRSLVIGAIDYTNTIARLKKWLPEKTYSSDNVWIGKNSWIDIFFHCDLIIIGLSLEPQETSLRWLLMERERYFRRHVEKRKKTLFVINSEHDKVGDGKKYFFESLKIDIKKYKLAAEIYKKWTMQ